MQNSIEVRSPFLDYRFINFSQKIPINLKYNSIHMKILLRKVVNNELPKNLFLKKKSGFTPPIENWILTQNPKLNEALILIKQIDFNIFNFYTNNCNNMSSYYKNLFEMKLIIFSNWYYNWIIKEHKQDLDINLHKKIIK
jgi:asparagine synthase (glutamine-hydrolysing)